MEPIDSQQTQKADKRAFLSSFCRLGHDFTGICFTNSDIMSVVRVALPFGPVTINYKIRPMLCYHETLMGHDKHRQLRNLRRYS